MTDNLHLGDFEGDFALGVPALGLVSALTLIVGMGGGGVCPSDRQINHCSKNVELPRSLVCLLEMGSRSGVPQLPARDPSVLSCGSGFSTFNGRGLSPVNPFQPLLG